MKTFEALSFSEKNSKTTKLLRISKIKTYKRYKQKYFRLKIFVFIRNIIEIIISYYEKKQIILLKLIMLFSEK